MAHHLDLIIRLLTGRYHGGEWPPSPARLYQALVAGAKSGAAVRDWSPTRQAALEWLEGLGPPEIFIRRTSDGRRYTTFVPNNSLMGTTSTKTSKQVAPKILADHCPGEPDIIYRWALASADSARTHLHSLDQIAAQLRALGWGTDFAAAMASLGDDTSRIPQEFAHFLPKTKGVMPLKLPAKGLLAHLDDCHQDFLNRVSRRGLDPNTRPTRFSEVRYQKASLWTQRRWIAFEMRDAKGNPFAVRWDQAQTVAAWIRHAASRALLEEELDESWINEFVLGHTSTIDVGQRLSYVPLPSIGHQKSDGGIRRVLVVEPPDTIGSDAEALDLLRVKLAGRTLTAEGEDRPHAMLLPLNDTSKVLPCFVRNARVWSTVTPVVLHGHNALRSRISLTKTDRLLRQAFEAAGIPEPLLQEIIFQRAPFWSGCESASEIRIPRHLAKWPRVHVRVIFRELVEGPVIAGIGRHYGIGLFAANEEATKTI